MPAFRTRDTHSQSLLEVFTDTMYPPTLAIVSPTSRAASFPLNQTDACPISPPFEADHRKCMLSPSKPTLVRPLSPVSPSGTESCTTLSRTSMMTSSVSTFLASPSSHDRRKSSVCSEIERRPRKGDDDYVKRPENAFILFRRQCCENRQAAQEEAAAVDGLTKKQCQADLSKTISQRWKVLSPEERLYWEELAKEKKKEHEQIYPNYVYRPQRAKDRKGKKGKRGEEEDSETTISFVLPLCAPAVGNHGRSASVPTPLPFQAVQIPSIYMPSRFASPSMVPMINRRASHPNYGSTPSPHFDFVASNTAIPKQHPLLKESLESRRSRYLENYSFAPLRTAVRCDVAWVAEPRRTTRVSAMEGRDLSASNLLEPTQETMIKMSIVVGQKQYLQNLRRKAFFCGRMLRECLDVIRKDIVTIWNLRGLDHCLMDDKLIETFLPVDIFGSAGTSQSTLRARMTRIKLDEPQFIPNVANEVANFVIAVLRMPYQRYQESVHGVEIFMSYIVNLICVMQVIFLLTPDHLVTRDTVDRAIDVWKEKREQLQISIKSFAEKQALRTLGQDQVLNEIETLIWQYSMSEQEAEELRQGVEGLGRKDETTKAGASSK